MVFNFVCVSNLGSWNSIHLEVLEAKVNQILAKEFHEPRFEATCNRESSCRRNQPTGGTLFYLLFMNGYRYAPEIKTP